ncbi:MAG: carboxypeptidase regulatory-like domain-containing protein [Hydrogenophaga sp.]|nr:carboxypeptidase regulatory-like domain-containing protein [Hydrogenophaga sp.]
MTVWIGNATTPITTMSNAVLSALGFTEVNHGGGYTRWADLNANGVEGNVLVVAAKQGESNDYFKLQQLEVGVVACPAPAKASLGSRVWCDSNGNGLQDSGEAGVAGVSVKLLDASNTVVATTTTNASGDYSFAGLAPADYQVEFVKPTGYGGFTLANQGSDDALDSDANPTTGRTGLTTLVAGENDPSWDAGLAPVNQVSTFAFAGCSASDGTDGNTRTSTVDGITVTASAWSRDKSSGAWAKAWLGAYTGGYGVTDSSEGSGSGSSHAVDNGGRDNFVVYQFSDKVVVDKAYLGYVSCDSDVSIWIGNYTGTISSMSNSVLSGLGFTEVNLGGSSARWADLNAAGVAGNTLVISAKVGESNDYFKVEKLVVAAPSKLVTPLVIDLGGDGIETTALQDSGGRFDLLGTGAAIHSGWITGDDAFLAIDRNRNSRIDDVSELFGGFAQGEAFARLAAFDDNGDGMVNASDARFAELRVWRDLDQNHETGQGELSTLEQAGVKSLGLASVFDPVLDAGGNVHGDTSTATLSDGKQVVMSDLFFAISASDGAGRELFTLNDLLPPTEAPLTNLTPALENQVSSLVQALATFAPASAGDSRLGLSPQNGQSPLLAASLS